MKQQISKRELALLDSLAVAADALQDAQESLVNGIVGLLAIESWDAEKIEAVRQFVMSGFGPIEPWLTQLGVAIGAQPDGYQPEVFTS